MELPEQLLRTTPKPHGQFLVVFLLLPSNAGAVVVAVEVPVQVMAPKLAVVAEAEDIRKVLCR
jgi:hypothetical protein